jgi:hypothetical protein
MTIYQQEPLRKLSKYGCTGKYSKKANRWRCPMTAFSSAPRIKTAFNSTGIKAVTDDWSAAEYLKNVFAKRYTTCDGFKELKNCS